MTHTTDATRDDNSVPAGRAPRRVPHPSGRPMRVGLWGNFGCGNIGNDATLAAALDLLGSRLRDAEFICICTNPEVVTARFGIPARPIYAVRSPADGPIAKVGHRFRDASHAYGAMGNLDYIIVPGTGPICDFGERPIGFPFAMMQMTLWARARGVPVELMAVGAGPIVHPLSRRILATATRLAAHRSFRDDNSRQLMMTLGVDTTRDAVVPDLVFSTDPTQQLGTARAFSPTAKGSPRTIGIGVMAYFGHKNDAVIGVETYGNYIEKMTSLVRHLLERGDSVRLLIGEQTDLRPLAAIEKALAGLKQSLPETRFHARRMETFPDLLEEIAATDLVVASRFHNVIGGLIMRRPTLSLSYSHRHNLLMSALGVGEWRDDIETFTVPDLVSKIDALSQNTDAYLTSVSSGVAIYRAELAANADVVCDRLLARARCVQNAA